MRQSVITETKLQAQARCHVPVVHGVSGRSLVDVVANWSDLYLRVAAGETQQHIHEGVARQVAEAQVALGVAEELLVLGVTVVAEAELHGVLAHGVGDVNLGLVVLRSVVPGRRALIFSYVVRSAPAAANARYQAGLPLLKKEFRLQPAGLLAVRAVGDVDDVAVVVDAGFNKQVRVDGAAQLDGRGVGRVRQACW